MTFTSRIAAAIVAAGALGFAPVTFAQDHGEASSGGCSCKGAASSMEQEEAADARAAAREREATAAREEQEATLRWIWTAP